MTAGIDSSTFSNLDKWKKGGWTDLEGIKFYNVKVFKDSNKNAIKKKSIIVEESVLIKLNT